MSGKLTWAPELYGLFGLDAKEGIDFGRWAKCVHPDDIDTVQASGRDLAERRIREYRGEFRTIHPRLGLRWILSVGYVDDGTDGAALRVRGLNMDVTARKRAEEALRLSLESLRDADRRKSEFLAVLSHELRNPLGLALVRGLVELHGGSVRARSEGLGRGAEFMVTLPLAANEVTSAKEAKAKGVSSARLVLVIEGNVDAGQSLADILELQGHRVRVARDGRSGIELARELRPDVVLCDIGLPDLSGYDVARALRRDESLRDTRLIALSGYAQPEDRQQAREAGFDAHVAKPTSLQELQDVVTKPLA